MFAFLSVVAVVAGYPGAETVATTWDRDAWRALAGSCATETPDVVVEHAKALHEAWRATARPPPSKFATRVLPIFPGWEEKNLHEALHAWTDDAVRSGCVDDIEAVAAAFPDAHLGRRALRTAACKKLTASAAALVGARWVELVPGEYNTDEAVRCAVDDAVLLSALVKRGFDAPTAALAVLGDDDRFARIVDVLHVSGDARPRCAAVVQDVELDDGEFGGRRGRLTYTPTASCDLSRYKDLEVLSWRNDSKDPPPTATLLTHAVLLRRTTSVKLLLGRGARPNVKTSYGLTPAHIAARNGDLDVLELLAARGAKLTACNAAGVSVGASALLALREGDSALPLRPWLPRFRGDAACRVSTATALAKLTPAQRQELAP